MEPDPEIGYSRTYHDFVTAWITHYRGRFDWIAIENEEESSLFWGGTADEYVRLLRTAVQAIRAVDPAVRVTDGGMVSTMWGLCAPRGWIASGRLTPEAANALMVDYFARAAATGVNEWVCETEEECAEQLADPRVDEECTEVETILAGVAEAADAVNFHFYEDWTVMDVVVDWLSEMAPGAALLSNEIGQRGDLDYARGEGLAGDVAKMLLTARMLGLSSVVWWTADTVGTPAPSPDKVSVLEPDGTDRPAAATFRLLADLLGRYEPLRVLSDGPSLYRYLFEGNALEAAWSEGGETTVTFVVPLGKTTATLVELDGAETPLPIAHGTVELTVGASPVFVLFE